MSSHRQCWQFKKKMLSLQHPSAHLWPYTVLHLWIAQDSLSSPPASPNQTVQQMDRPKRQANGNICCWRSCWRWKSSGLAQRGDVLVAATAVSAGGSLESPSESPGLIAPAGPTPRARPQLPKDGVLLGAPPPKGTRATSAHGPGVGGIIHTLLVLTWRLQKQTMDQMEESRRSRQGAFSTKCDSPGTSAPRSLSSSLARGTWALLCLWAATRTAAKQLK